MFPTFSGNSRRLRNVNLSGQRHSNPFTAHSLSPGTGSGASKTVANAQAGRRQRQQERDELKAARSIQRTWRGHQARRNTKARHRQALAELYDSGSSLSPEVRVAVAFPLLMAAFDTRKTDDARFLCMLVEDLAKTDYAALASGQLSRTRLWHLVHILVTTLSQNQVQMPSSLLLFDLLTRVIQIRQQALLNSLQAYFKMLVGFYNKGKDVLGKNTTSYLEQAIFIPLAPREDTPVGFLQRAYSEFAETFLAQPLLLLENSTVSLASHIDVEALSLAVVNVYGTKQKPRPNSEELVYLLAHLVDLQNQLPEDSQGSLLYLKAIYTQLSFLSNIIRLRFASSPKMDEEKPFQDKYLETHIRSLVDKEEITRLLKRFTASQSNSTEQDYESLLAGYAIVLIRCFPDKGDDIRMQFFLADLPTKSGPQPAVRVFWEASSATDIFHQVLKSPKATLDILLRRKNDLTMLAPGENESSWDRDWRTILLFLELYTFVLRLTDDDDFFSAFANSTSPFRESQKQPKSRLRSSALSLPSLETLTLFLKNLSFTLLYNASDLLKNDTDNSLQSAFSSAKPKRSGQVGNYYVVPGLDFRMFKTIVTTAIQMLYERDSRRKFLPTDHWHMTSYFDMAQFVPAVVSEEQRQHDLRHAGNADEDEDVDMDEEDSEDEMEDHSYSASSRSFARTSRYALLERMRRQREKSQRDRLLATIGPKLEILRNMPYVLPFEARVRIFREFVHLDKLRRRDGFPDPDAWRAHMMDRHGGWGENSPARLVVARHSARIRRDSIFESALNQFWELGEGLKEPIQITFIDDFGNEEAGIDGGGVTKEFLTCALMQVLSPEEDLFESNTENAIYPSPTKFDQTRLSLQRHGLAEGSAEWDEQMASLMKHYEFIGRMIGKCLYEGILIDFVFAGFFLLKWALSATDSVYRANLNDLREMDEELYQGLLMLKNYDGDVADFGTDFTLQDQVSRKGDRVLTETRNLIPNGDKIPVTNENRLLYISYVARHRLMVQPHLVTKAFLRGLGTIIDPVWLRMFNQHELQRLVGGDSSEIDVEDLRRNTIYGGLYVIGDDHEEHPTVKLFWDVVQSLPDDDRRLLLKYVTSTPRAPLLGFSQLSPKFSIRDAGTDEARLPSTSTCVNLLKLPRYSTEETLREKLLYAIRSNARFDLS
ncbi:ubiquitin-protein ligase (E3) [Sporothrix curviconia]|uniref:HECT-type E3 ubiquitin transferase n=1 Tax=Sporothrix curviconia TaxID=1260050 RepID=A0ABP0CNZ9_9PEZI